MVVAVGCFVSFLSVCISCVLLPILVFSDSGHIFGLGIHYAMILVCVIQTDHISCKLSLNLYLVVLQVTLCFLLISFCEKPLTPIDSIVQC
jgi:hypothetical protein